MCVGVYLCECKRVGCVSTGRVCMCVCCRFARLYVYLHCFPSGSPCACASFFSLLLFGLCPSKVGRLIPIFFAHSLLPLPPMPFSLKTYTTMEEAIQNEDFMTALTMAVRLRDRFPDVYKDQNVSFRLKEVGKEERV